MMDTIILATRNKGKVAEFGLLLEPYNLKVLGLDAFPSLPEVLEDGKTFEENALKKARETAQATGLVAVADDSGLEVEFLDMAPGVYSARYSAAPGRDATDERNNAKLLEALKDVPESKRRARFCSCMAAVAPNGESITGQGFWEGLIAFEPRGGNGFGYDPLFYDPLLGKTAAELTMNEKNKVSHRAKASQALLEKWPGFWAKASDSNR